MLNLNPKITAAGLALFPNEATPGFSVAISHVAVGTGNYTPTGEETALVDEVARFPVAGGKTPAINQIQIGFTIGDLDEDEQSPNSQWIGELGFYVGDTLFAILSKPLPALFYKSPGVDIPIAYTMDVSSLPDGYVTVNSTAAPDALSSLIAVHASQADAHPDIAAELAKVSPMSKLAQQVYLLVITGQSNAAGANSGGPNPASSKVKVWDGVTGAWGSSNYTQNPFARAYPDGNNGNNNIGLAFAHRLADETGARVYVVYDAWGGRPIEDWMGAGTASVRYVGIKNKVIAALASAELVAAGKTKADFMIWAQGEENALTDTYADYIGKFTTLDNQFRTESWMDAKTPMFVMGMSGLHNRYQVWQAQLDYCQNVNRACVYVNSAGLKTQFDVDGTGDFTHWLGSTLWEHGYHRVWYALQERGMSHRTGLSSLYSRGSGPWRGQADAIALYDNLVGYSSRTGGVGVTDNFTGDGTATAFTLTIVGGTISSVTVNGVAKTSPADYSVSGQTLTFTSAPANTAAIVVTYSQTITGPAATGSISWGYRCYADGNYSMAGGYLVTTDNLCNYSFGWGRQITFDANGDYSGGFGFQNSVIANYGLVAGRGNTVADAGGAAVGQFSKQTTAQGDNVMFQVGIGTSTSARKNGLAVRKSGIVEMDNLPVYADNAAATTGGLVAGQLYRTATGTLMVRY